MPFAAGERVIVRTRRGKRVVEFVGVFQELVTKSRARVLVWDATGTVLDDEGDRTVALASLAPYHSERSDLEKRARHTVRLYNQGIRYFRIGHDAGKKFVVETLDAERGIVVGHVLHRKTLQIVQPADLWPMRY
jgi:hypothetical protein